MTAAAPTPLVAFYAPGTDLHDPAPSGHRRAARLLIAALTRAGFEPRIAARFTTASGASERLRRVAGRMADRLTRRIARLPAEGRPRLFLSFLGDGAAPDWIGPAVARRAGLPFAVAITAAAAADAAGNTDHPTRPALDVADCVLALGSGERLPDAIAGRAGLVPVAPFTDTGEFGMALPDAARDAFRRMVGAAYGLDPGAPWIATVAMMRRGPKLASYRLMAEALGTIADRPWQLAVAGDGPARAEVAMALFPLGPERVRLLGHLRGGDFAALLRASDLFAWPAREEAFAMAVLEAGAAGLPVVACRTAATSAIVETGATGTLVPAEEPRAFARAVAALLEAPDEARAMGRAAAERIRTRHGLERAGETLARALGPIVRSAA